MNRARERTACVAWMMMHHLPDGQTQFVGKSARILRGAPNLDRTYTDMPRAADLHL